MFVNSLNFLRKGHERSLKIKRNFVASFLISAVAIALGFVRVPIILDYLQVTEYGIWLVLTSIVSWFGFLDIGLGNGLRNKLAEALANNDLESAKTYVSTTYAALAVIIFVIYCTFLCIQPLLNWNSILNAPSISSRHLSYLVLIFATSYAIEFVVNLIARILDADQKPAIGQFFGVITSTIFLLILLVLYKMTTGSLIYLAFAYHGSNLLIICLASIYLYRKRYNFLMPSFRFIKLGCISEIGGLGIKFFIMQISTIILFASDNMIITQVTGPEHVTVYNIARKYMELPVLFFSFLTMPLWSAFTDAFTKKDIIWIKWAMKKTIILWGAVLVLCVLQVLVSRIFYRLWIGDKVDVPLFLTCLMAISSIVSAWTSPFVAFMNGISKVGLIMYICCFTALFNIPLSIYFSRGLNMGSEGVILATIVCLFVAAILTPIQYYKIINNTASGIWSK